MVLETVIIRLLGWHSINRIINTVLTKSEQLHKHMAYLTTRYVYGNLVGGGGREGIAGETHTHAHGVYTLLPYMAYLTTRYVYGNLVGGGGREGIAGETLHAEFVGDGSSRSASLVAMNLVSNTHGTQPLVLRPLRTPGSKVKGHIQKLLTTPAVYKYTVYSTCRMSCIYMIISEKWVSTRQIVTSILMFIADHVTYSQSRTWKVVM